MIYDTQLARRGQHARLFLENQLLFATTETTVRLIMKYICEAAASSNTYFTLCPSCACAV